VEAAKSRQEGVDHVKGGILRVLAHLILIALFMESPDDMHGEEPESAVDPRD